MTVGWIYFSVFLAVIIPGGVTSDQEAQELFTKASNDFAIDLLQTQSKLWEGNVILSPSSIGILLAILQQGARENTLKQLETVLRTTAEQSKNGHDRVLKSLAREKTNVTLEWGNRAYIRPGFEISEAFNSTIRENFGATVQELNFVEPSPDKAAEVINNWVKEVTHDNIRDLIPSSALTPNTVMVLLNAIYFKGLWDVPFSKTLTKNEKFYLSPDDAVDVFFMSQKERFVAGEDPETGVMWVDLPFKDEKFSMLFLLPIERHALNGLMEKMSGSLLLKIIDDWETRQVTLTIPKFKLNEKVLLAEPLEKLGLTDIFTDAANLQGMAVNYSNLRVSKVIHQAGVEVDEEGSTAFAATAIVTEALSFPKANDHLTFRADHPFLFFILDKTNKIPLFAGKVVDPR